MHKSWIYLRNRFSDEYWYDLCGMICVLLLRLERIMQFQPGVLIIRVSSAVEAVNEQDIIEQALGTRKGNKTGEGQKLPQRVYRGDALSSGSRSAGSSTIRSDPHVEEYLQQSYQQNLHMYESFRMMQYLMAQMHPNIQFPSVTPPVPYDHPSPPPPNPSDDNDDDSSDAANLEDLIFINIIIYTFIHFIITFYYNYNFILFY